MERSISPGYADGSFAAFCREFGGEIKSAWCEETAYPGSWPLPEGAPLSLGQCGVTTALLMRHAEHEFPDHDLYIACGNLAVVALGKAALNRAIKGHAWIQHSYEPESMSTVVDLTADQAVGVELPTCIVSTDTQLEEAGVAYEPRRMFMSSSEYVRYMAKYQDHFVPRLTLLSRLSGRQLY